MFNYDKLILGFKKRVQVQLTFDNLRQKKLTIVIVGLILLISAIGLILFKPWQAKISVSTQKPAEKIPKPLQATPQTNPFEVKINPFKDIKTNPFR